MTIYFLRHAKTKANRVNIWCGNGTNIDICKKNINELEIVSNKIKNIKISTIICSPLLRCVNTAKMIQKYNPFTKIQFDNYLIERSFGDLEGKIIDENHKLKLSNWDINTDLSCGVEKIQDMYFLRILPFINKLKNEFKPEDCILLVSHSWVGRLLKYHFSHNTNDILIAPKNLELMKFEI